MDQIKNVTIRTSDQLFSKLIKMTPTDKVARYMQVVITYGNIMVMNIIDHNYL